jgi:[ribosomal protein S18]-alanine N-acetyltransferase
MPVTTATATSADLPAVRALLRTAARSNAALGDEDLAMLVEAGNVLMATTGVSARRAQHDRPDAVAAFYPEPRPASLPAAEPDRVFLRAAAFRSGVSPSSTLHDLLNAWCRLPARRKRLLIAYGGEPWYNRSLLAAQCVLAAEVIYFELSHLDRKAGGLPVRTGGAATLRPATMADLGELALLDAACFDVLWHMGPADLRQLLLFGRLIVAELEGSLAGYMALTTRDDVGQVARLAVHPAWGGRGIGRQLLVDGLQAAADLGCQRAVLNTQANNQRSQSLYRSLGFHPTGERFGVYTRQDSDG